MNRFSALFLTALLLIAAPALAQQQPAAVPVQAQTAAPAPDGAFAQLNAAGQTLQQLTDAAEAAKADDGQLSEIKVQVDDVGKQVVGIIDASRTRLDQIKNRLTELGEPPAAGEPAEAQVLTEERSRLLKERGDLTAVTGAAETLRTQATGLSAAITETRRSLFSTTLLRHTDINLDMLSEAGQALGAEQDAFVRRIGSWLTFVLTFKSLPLLSAILLSLCSALVLLAGTRRLFDPVIRRTARDTHPSYIARLSVAFWSTMIPTIAAGTFAATAFFFLQTFNVLRQDIAPIVSMTLAVGVAMQFIWTISTAVLAPAQSAWRLVRVSDRGAWLLVGFIVAMAFVNSLDYLLGTISVALGSPLVLTVFKSLFASIIIGLMLMAMALIKPVVPLGEPLDGQGRPWPRAISVLFLLAGFVLIVSALLGYVGLSRFIATQIVVTGAIAVTMYIGILSGKAIAKQGALGQTVIGRYLVRRFRLEQIALDQAGLAMGLTIYLLVAMFFVPLIMLQWGFQFTDIEAWAYRVFTDIRIGTITISLVSIFAGILLFVTGYLVTRWFQRWLDRTVMARSRVDAGVRNSVSTGIGYLGLGIAALIGISAAGFNLSSLALVAGALSLGVGFGLQNIVSNFVSGLILLVERPFKVGDWVISGTTEGFVKRISVRATEIETFQRQTIMVPNSLFINASVGNWTHRNKLGRVDIPFSVHASNDPRKVISSLEAMLADQRNILRNPEPQVVFLGFSDATLDFQVRVYLADVLGGVGVRTEIRLATFERFQQDDIALGGPGAPEVAVKITPQDAERLASLFRGAGLERSGGATPLDENPASPPQDLPPASLVDEAPATNAPETDPDPEPPLPPGAETRKSARARRRN